MTDQPDLRDQITGLFRDGSLYRESPAGIADAVLGVVEPVRAELERLHSWAGLMELLDEHWPADIFPGRETAAERSEEDGPRVVSLIRALGEVEASRRDWAAEAAEGEVRFQDLLGSIWLYVDWQYVTRQLTTEQKKLWADAVDASGDPNYRHEPKADRWWRPRLCTCGHEAHAHHVLTVGKIGCQVCECSWFLAARSGDAEVSSVHPEGGET